MPARACGLTIWHKPASREARVEIVGDWDDWKRPGVTPDAVADGYRVAAFDPSPGEHAYAIVEDGVWLTDESRPLTAFHDGREVAFAIVPDCAAPELRVDDVQSTPDGDAVVHATFLAARSKRPVDPASVQATLRAGGGAGDLSVTAVDPSTGAVTLEAHGLSRGKYTYQLSATDLDGAAAEPANAIVWIEPRTWDPRDAIVYQVVIDRFADASGPLAAPATPSSRAGGTLAGVRRAIERGDIEALGANTLWLSPLYENPTGEFTGNDGRLYSSYHGYWPIASRALDERVASEDELDDFMRLAHRHGLRILFDVVPNHVHEQHPWTREHPDWFNDGCLCGQGSCDWATNIKTCRFAPYLPDVDWTRADTSREATEAVMWWFDRFDADGLRIDAVPMTPRAATRRIVDTARRRYTHGPHTPWIIGENFTGPGAYGVLRYDLGPFGLDGSFDFPFMWTLRSAVASETAPMSSLDDGYRAGVAAWGDAGAIMGTMIGNHDVSRFASVSAGSDGGDTWEAAPQPLDPVVYAKQRLALAAVFTMPGAPVLFYGDEVGLAGKSDPDCRRVMPDEAGLLPAQRETRAVVRSLGTARACSAALRRGTMKTLLADRERFVFVRQTDDDVAVIALARRPSRAATVKLPAALPPLVDRLSGEPADVTSGALTLGNDAFSVQVFLPADSACAR